MLLVSSCSCLCPIHWSQALSWEWRCIWSTADKRCSNYIWVINNFIAYQGVTYIRGLVVDGIINFKSKISLQCKYILHFLFFFHLNCEVNLRLEVKSLAIKLFIQQCVQANKKEETPKLSIPCHLWGFKHSTMMDSPHKGPVVWKAFPSPDIIMKQCEIEIAQILWFMKKSRARWHNELI